jgi:acetylglutamate kinase
VNVIEVVKLGGSLLDDPARKDAVLRDIAAAWAGGRQLVVVHGGGKHVDAMLARLGIPKRTHAGLRITDSETLDVVVAVLAGLVNKSLVADLSAIGVNAAGISGADASTIVAAVHHPLNGVDLGNVGQVTSSDPALLRLMLSQRILPVVSSVALGPGGTLLNVNADSAASAIAVSLEAGSLRFLTDVPGVLDKAGFLVPSLVAPEVEGILSGSSVSGGMRPKLEAALRALRSGVSRITIGEEGGTTLVAA